LTRREPDRIRLSLALVRLTPPPLRSEVVVVVIERNRITRALEERLAREQVQDRRFRAQIQLADEVPDRLSSLERRLRELEAYIFGEAS
jgi:hypothetical protein